MESDFLLSFLSFLTIHSHLFPAFAVFLDIFPLPGTEGGTDRGTEGGRIEGVCLILGGNENFLWPAPSLRPVQGLVFAEGRGGGLFAQTS